MKKILFSLGVMLSAFALTNCTQEIENPAQQPESAGYPFEIVASTADTKTVNDGMSTKWAEGDQINLFHIEASDEAEVKNDGAFTVSDIDAGTFTGNLSEPLTPEAEYAWYAFYPYSSYIETPANTSKGWMPVGSKSNEKQVQTGNNNMDHIAGPNYPMAGWAETYPDEPTPNFTMYHLTSLIEINVTNDNDEALTVDEIAFTAPVNIIGTYFINFASPWGIDNDPDAFTPSGENYVSKTATLKVNNATALAKGESAKFYLAIKPFIAGAGDKLVLSVNGCSKDIQLSSDVAFRYGKIKTLRFAYDKVSTGKTATFDFNTNEWELPVSVNGTDEEKNNGNITESVVCGDVTMTAYNPSNATNKIRMWQGTEKTDLRAYRGSSLAFSVPEGYVVTKMTFTGDSAGDAAITPASGSYSSKVWIGKSNPALFTFNATVKFDTIVVEYEEGTGDSPELPETEQPEPEEPADPIAVSVTDFINAEDGDTVYELTGKVAEIYQAYNSQYNNISFFIEDATGKVLIYRMSCDGIENPNSITVGDDITVQGTKTTYYDDPQMAQGSKCISYTDNDASDIPEGPKIVTINEFLNATDNAIEYQLSGTISGIYQAYDSSYDNISIYISDETGDEVLVYRLSCAGITDPANTITKGDLITVKGYRTLYNEVAQMAQGGVIVEHTDVVVEQPTGSATLSFADKANRTSFSTTQQIWEQNGVKLINDKGSSSSNVADYANPARFYKSSKITVEYTGMTKIVFVCSSSSYATALNASITDNDNTVSVSGTEVTVEMAEAVDSYEIASLTGGQVRMSSVTVYAE